MPNDAKLGLVVGVGVVLAIAVVFFRKENGDALPISGETAASVAAPSAAPPAAPAARPVKGRATSQVQNVGEPAGNTDPQPLSRADADPP
jgi:hypothetical protein